MNTAFNLPPAKRDGELLDTATANKLIEAVNRLAAIQVQTVRASGMVKSGLLVSKENAVLALAYRDAANVLGTAATIDIVTPFSGRRRLRVQNGRNGSGGTVIINDDETVEVIPPTRSGGIGTRRTAASAVVKVSGSYKSVSAGYYFDGFEWSRIADFASVSLEYQSKSSNYTLVGYSEYASPSSPPRKYLQQSLSGAGRFCFSGTPPCGGTAIQTDRYTYSGSYIFNPDTGTVLSNNQKVEFHLKNSGACATDWPLTSSTTIGQTFDPDNYHSGFDIVTNNAALRMWSGIGCDGVFSNYTGDIYADLLSEDTEEDAIARANASQGWDAPAKTVAKNDTRGAGDFTSAYVYVQWRAAVSGLDVGVSYNANATYGRRAYGSGGAFVFYASVSVPFVATGGSEYTPWEDIPNDSGYETNVLSIEIVPA